MALRLPKNIVSNNNMQNVLYLVTLALAVSYIMNRQNLALVSLLVIAGGVYMFKKNVVIALGVSIIITNLLLSMNYFKQFEGFKEGNRSTSGIQAHQKREAGARSFGDNYCPPGQKRNDNNECESIVDDGTSRGRSGRSGGRRGGRRR